MRIGLIIPANNVVLEPEYYSLGLRNVTFHAQRLIVRNDSRKGLLEMLRGVDSAARVLSIAEPDVIAYCCLSSSFIRGFGWDKQLSSRIQKESGVVSIAAATAMLRALQDLEMTRIVTVSAYNQTINSMMVRFLEQNGIEVIKSLALGLEMNKVGSRNPLATYKSIKKVFTKKADGLFIGSTDLRSMSIIDSLEKEFGRPVVTVNQAVLRYASELAGRRIKVSGFGKLLR